MSMNAVNNAMLPPPSVEKLAAIGRARSELMIQIAAIAKREGVDAALNGSISAYASLVNGLIEDGYPEMRAQVVAGLKKLAAHFEFGTIN